MHTVQIYLVLLYYHRGICTIGVLLISPIIYFSPPLLNFLFWMNHFKVLVSSLKLGSQYAAQLCDAAKRVMPRHVCREFRLRVYPSDKATCTLANIGRWKIRPDTYCRGNSVQFVLHKLYYSYFSSVTWKNAELNTETSIQYNSENITKDFVFPRFFRIKHMCALLPLLYTPGFYFHASVLVLSKIEINLNNWFYKLN